MRMGEIRYRCVRRRLSDLGRTGNRLNQAETRTVRGREAAIFHLGGSSEKRKGFPDAVCQINRLETCRKSLRSILPADLFCPENQLRTSLLGRNVADDGELEFFVVVSLVHQENPASKHGQSDHCKSQSKQPQHTKSTGGEKQ